jgi:opine dehydrogenase
MRIAVLGAGNAGTAIAADLSLKGHEVTLAKTSTAVHQDHFAAIEENGGCVTIVRDTARQQAQLHRTTRDLRAAIADADVVIVFTQTTFHEPVARAIGPYLQPGQIVILEPGYLGTVFFLKAGASNEVLFVEAESSPIDCRIMAPGEVTVLFENVRNPIGVFPRSETDAVLKRLLPFGYNFTPTNGVIEAALHNPNLIVHTVGAIMSIPRIEYTHGDYWMYKEVFTPHVWNIVESLDGEKMDILGALGAPRLPYVEACRWRNFTDITIDPKAAFFDYAMNHSPKGPSEVEARYITEDVPEGLVMLESLGKALDVATPTCTALIGMASAALRCDYRSIGRTIDQLGESQVRALIEDSLGHCALCPSTGDTV